MNDYGQGRIAVIKEMMIFCDKEILILRKLINSEDNKYMKAAFSGQKQSLFKIKGILKRKLHNCLEKEKLLNNI